jgi:hypothetical protein
MKFKKVLNSFSEGIKLLVKNPSLILSGLGLWLILQGISVSGSYLAPNFQTTASNVAWVIIVWLVSFVAGAYALAGMIGIAKKEKDKFFSSANKFWLRNFLILVFILLVSFIIGRVAHYGAFYIGRAANLATTRAVVIFVLIYLIGLIGVLVFLTFSNFFLVTKKLKIHEAVRESARFVKKNYFASLFLNVLFFGLFFALDWVKNFVGDILLFGLVLPYFVAVLTKFVETADLKKSEK